MNEANDEEQEARDEEQEAGDEDEEQEAGNEDEEQEAGDEEDSSDYMDETGYYLRNKLTPTEKGYAYMRDDSELLDISEYSEAMPSTLDKTNSSYHYEEPSNVDTAREYVEDSNNPWIKALFSTLTYSRVQQVLPYEADSKEIQKTKKKELDKLRGDLNIPESC